MSKEHTGLGIMSGTSLDGIDLAVVRFSRDAKWDYQLLEAVTIDYPLKWKEKLHNAFQFSAIDLAKLDIELGTYIGESAKKFLEKHQLEIDFISSHGHTIFHQPQKKISVQIGHGQAIADTSGRKVINDFRTADVLLGGQGAPLVPIGDQLLFGSYAYCLNLGGISNISFNKQNKRIAYDICPVNMALNYLSNQLGQSYDRDGNMGMRGNLNKQLLTDLNKLSFYREKPPKSLGREWFEKVFLPVLNSYSGIEPIDQLATLYEHIAVQISRQLEGNGKMLITGGGAHNSFLLSKIREKTNIECHVPNKQVIDFKEAIVFAFMGLLRLLGETNCYSSVTGALNDSSTGVIFMPNR